MSACLLCRAATPEPLIDLGLQPVATHFQRAPDELPIQHELGLGVCPACGLVQLLKPFPYKSLVPPYDWITYREPERHLDEVVEKVCGLPGIDETSTIAGISYKDHTTLDRFARRGFANTWCIDPSKDLGVTDPKANIETVHGLLTPEAAAAITERRGLADVVIARHILEHAEVPWRFLQSLSTLLRDGGYMVLEVPDCGANLDRQDYTMIWEEHTLYFTAETFAGIMTTGDCQGLGVDIHPYVFENCLVQVGRKLDPAHRPAIGVPQPPNLALARRYADGFAPWSEAYRRVLANRSPVALYGAGHLSCAFINFHGLADQIAFVVDDTPQKQGLFLPKSGVPIVPRATLNHSRVPLCLLGLAPESEDKVIGNNSGFSDAGGRFYSIFATSERSIRRALI